MADPPPRIRPFFHDPKALGLAVVGLASFDLSGGRRSVSMLRPTPPPTIGAQAPPERDAQRGASIMKKTNQAAAPTPTVRIRLSKSTLKNLSVKSAVRAGRNGGNGSMIPGVPHCM
jgi:hypothetical protein